MQTLQVSCLAPAAGGGQWDRLATHIVCLLSQHLDVGVEPIEGSGICRGQGESAVVRGSAPPSFLVARSCFRQEVLFAAGGLVLNAKGTV